MTQWDKQFFFASIVQWNANKMKPSESKKGRLVPIRAPAPYILLLFSTLLILFVFAATMYTFVKWIICKHENNNKRSLLMPIMLLKIVFLNKTELMWRIKNFSLSMKLLVIAEVWLELNMITENYSDVYYLPRHCQTNSLWIFHRLRRISKSSKATARESILL